MPRILLIKTSSMGDVVHNLPVASDLRAAFPDSRIDWVVEKAFAAIPAMHPAVSEVIPVSIRRWRRHPFAGSTRREFSELRGRLRASRYDAVIDTQGLLKSAVIARLANGFRHGLDWRSSREPLAIFYDKVHAVPWSAHAVQRNRTLASMAMDYPPADAVRYGISPGADASASVASFTREHRLESFAVLLHATSATEKEWPEQNWIDLGSRLAENGVTSVLPFGSDRELERSVRLASRIPAAIVPPALGLDALAALLSRARIVVGVDTGLSHLAVALGKPTIGVYVATSPSATGLFGTAFARNLGNKGKPPASREVADAVKAMLGSK